MNPEYLGLSAANSDTNALTLSLNPLAFDGSSLLVSEAQ